MANFLQNFFGGGQQQQMQSPVPAVSSSKFGNNLYVNSGINKVATPYQGPLPANTSLQQETLFRTTGQGSGSVLGSTIGGSTSGSSGSSGGSSSYSSGGGNVSNPYENLSPQGVSDEEINSIYNPQNEYLNQAEGNLRGQLPGLISEAESQASAQRSLLGDKRTSAFGQLDQSLNAANVNRDNQEAQQRQLLQELGQANQQRFGGASSAGQAASEIQGREFQRNLGGIGQNYQQASQQIQQKRVDVDNEYNTGLQQLQANTQTAINDINRRFQDKLLEITRLRSDNESAKAQARLGALQELRNSIFQINVQKAEFQSALDQQRNANLSGLQQAESQLSQFVTQGQGAASKFGATQGGGMSGVSQQQAANPYQLMGQITSSKNNNDLQLQLQQALGLA